jgi:lysophospholipase L1-like esterase
MLFNSFGRSRFQRATLMSRFGAFFGLLFLVSMSGSAFATDPPPIRVMPLGDSSTSGFSVPTFSHGYRSTLYNTLLNAGYNVDYVGTQIDTQSPAMADPDHEGHGGVRIDEIQAGIDDWLTLVDDPDVVLLLIGINDFSQGYNTASAINRLENLVAQIATSRPYARILVSNLLLRTDYASLEAAQSSYNNSIPAMVNHQVSLGHKVYFVDIHSTFTASDLSSDGQHPNQSGYNKMAAAWATAITNVISPLGTTDPPAIARATSIDSTHVTVTFTKPVEDAATNLANFSLSGGATISQANLDSESNRVITLTTSLLTNDVTYTLFVSGVRDRTPQHGQIAPGSSVAYTSERLTNGSFESGNYTGWTASGNQGVVVGNAYPTTDGADVVVFNGGQSTPNGVLSQSITTTAGQKYVLRFDAGVVAYNTNEQRLKVTVQGSGVLLSNTVSLFGLGGGVAFWAPKTYSFVANSATTTLSFQDMSPTSADLDLLLDHVRLSASVARTLTVTSSPNSGVGVTVSPTDKNGAGNGTTGFNRTYSEGTVVSLTAPVFFGANIFQKWQKDGADSGNSLNTSVTIDGDHTLNAVYVPAGPFTNGSFESGYTGWTQSGNQMIHTDSYATTNGASVLVFAEGNSTPNGVVSQSFATTAGQSYMLNFDLGVTAFQSTAAQRMQVTVQGSGNPLISQILSVFGQGTGSWYTPESFTFVANSSVTTLTFQDVSQTSANIDLLLDNVRVIGNAPTANAQSVTTNEDTAKAITLTGSDPNGDPLTFSVVTNPAHGTLSGTAPNLTYTPAANYNGPDSFTFKANDGTADSNIATVSITITAVNDAPTASPQSVTTNEDTAKAITLSGSDVDGDTLTFSVVTNPTHGTLSGTPPNLSYTPASNYNGPDSFTFKANDGTADSNIATVSITVTAVNDAPTASPQSVTTNEDTAKAITLTGSDVDGDTLTFSVTTNPTHGTLSGTAPNLTYTPAANYNGPDTFTFKANDGTFDSNTATVSITVTAINDPPTADGQSVATDQNTSKAITLTGSDTETSSGSLTFAVTVSPTHGTLTGTPPNLTYSPDANYNGSDSFKFTVTDTGDGASPPLTSSEATISITVNGVPEIAVEQPTGTGLTDGGSTIDFGNVAVDGNNSHTFTIKNLGAANLTGLTITLNGANSAEFTITAPPTAPVAPGGSTTFTVKFSPAALGARAAALHIASNDADENPFDISLTGTGITNLEAWRLQYFGSIDNSGDGADGDDFDLDGLSNLLEFATGNDPKQSSQMPGTLSLNGDTIEFVYTRAKAAINDGLTFNVEWSDDLTSPNWNTVGVSEVIVSEDSTLQQVKATIPVGTSTRRFVRLKVNRP